jgi:hypothetical protein
MNIQGRVVPPYPSSVISFDDRAKLPGKKFFFKIDPYDADMRFGSEDPAHFTPDPYHPFLATLASPFRDGKRACAAWG